MITLCAACSAILPLASETEVSCALSSNVVVAKVVIEGFWIWKSLVAVDPLAVIAGSWRLFGNDRRCRICGGRRRRLAT